MNKIRLPIYKKNTEISSGALAYPKNVFYFSKLIASIPSKPSLTL